MPPPTWHRPGFDELTRTTMTATIRAATDDDITPVSKYLAHRLGGPGAHRFERFFAYQWSPRVNLGYLIEDGGSVRGFIGAIYSVRRIRGEQHNVCNINSWSVDADYRTYTLKMAQRLLAQPGLTFTCFSPSPVVAECLRFFKFQTAAVEKVLFTPMHGWARRIARRAATINTPKNTARFESSLDAAEVQIYRDHAPYRCGHLVIERGQRRCYVVTVRRGRGQRAFADVLYVSDPDLFAEEIALTHSHLFRQHGTILTGIDVRLLQRAPSTYVYRGLRPWQFRSRELGWSDIDGLYSELVLTYG